MIDLSTLIRTTLCAATFLAFSMSAHASPVSGQGTWETTLKPRDLNGDGAIDAFFDTALNITWMSNWNRAADELSDINRVNTIVATVNALGGIDGHVLTTADFWLNGLSWWGATAWASQLDYFGYTGWRLPTTMNPDPSCSYQFFVSHGYGCTGSELGMLFHTELGNEPRYAPTNTGDFVRMEGQPRLWTSTLFPPNPNAAMNFNFSEGGLQDLAFKNNGLYAVAVHDGDIFLTPEPSILVLLAVSLIAGLMTSRPTKRLLASAIS